ncbi:MAG: alpha/beta fold hydrolase [Desulfopila sp.]
MAGATESMEIELPCGSVHLKRWIPARPPNEVPVVLLHDSLGSVDLWRDFPERLATTLSRCVIAYDRLGFGRSSPRLDRPSLHFIEEEASATFPCLKERLGLGRYILLGHSVGGAMSIVIAAGDPDCQGVVTMAAQAAVEELTVASIARAKRMFAGPGQLERLARWHGVRAPWVLRAWTEVWLDPAFASWSLADCQKRVHCPVLAIHGLRDEYGSTTFAQSIAATTTGGSEVLLVDAGHMVHREKTAEVLEAIRSFLHRVTGASTP